jgi:LPS-assembly lipoprotein
MKNRKLSYRIRVQFLGFLGLIFLLNACGFQPIYGNISPKVGAQSTEDLLSSVYIQIIPNFEGQFLRNQLIDSMHNTGAAPSFQYVLKIGDISETKRDLDITKESNATIAQLRLATSLTLRRKSDNKIILKKSLWSTTSYNILESQFTTRISKDYARENGLKNIAQQIQRQVSLALKNNRTTR